MTNLDISFFRKKIEIVLTIGDGVFIYGWYFIFLTYK